MACSVDGLRSTFAFEFDLAGEGELGPPNKLMLPFLRVFCVTRLEELFVLLPTLLLGVLTGVAGGEAKGMTSGVGSGGWPRLRSRASISSGVRLTLVFPFVRAFAIFSTAAETRASSLSRATACNARSLYRLYSSSELYSSP